MCKQRSWWVHDMKRRTLLSRLGGTTAVTAVAGCLTGSGETTETGDAGEQETLEPIPSESATTTEPTATATSGSEEATSDGTASEEPATATAETPDIAFRTAIETIEKCSKTCRTLTYAVQNRGTEAAPDVSVRIRVFTGGNEVWDKNQSVGTVDARSQRTGISRDIDVGLLGGRKIQNNDGEVTIKLTPQSAGVSKTFTYERTLDV